MKKITKNENQTISDSKVTDLQTQRIKKNVINQIDPDHRDEVEDFLKRFKDDTLTGL